MINLVRDRFKRSINHPVFKIYITIWFFIMASWLGLLTVFYILYWLGDK
jgi:hypothetical protein